MHSAVTVIALPAAEKHGVADFDDLYVLVDDFGAFALATASVML